MGVGGRLWTNTLLCLADVHSALGQSDRSEWPSTSHEVQTFGLCEPVLRVLQVDLALQDAVQPAQRHALVQWPQLRLVHLQQWHVCFYQYLALVSTLPDALQHT